MFFSSDFQNGFSLSCSTTDFLTIIADAVAIAFDISGATQGRSLWHDGLLDERNSYGISCQAFSTSSRFSALFSSQSLRRRIGRVAYEYWGCSSFHPWSYCFPATH